MKAGYYINESNNIVIVYPKGYNSNEDEPYTLDLYILKMEGRVWKKVHYPEHLFKLLPEVIDFSYIGPL